MPYVMFFFYFLYTFLLSSFAVAVASLKDQSLAVSPRNDAINNLVSLVLILVTSIWYLGWIGGVIAFAFHILSLPHATFGWLLSIPATLRFKRIALGNDFYTVDEIDNAMRRHSSRFESWFLVLTWAYFIFLVSSFFTVPFRSFLSWWTLPRILIFIVICAVGFCVRTLVQSKLQQKT